MLKDMLLVLLHPAAVESKQHDCHSDQMIEMFGYLGAA